MRGIAPYPRQCEITGTTNRLERHERFGNLLRHAYHRIDPNLLWLTAERDLPPLKAFVERIIKESETL
jgi:uncharacterized protein with HEPN domain